MRRGTTAAGAAAVAITGGVAAIAAAVAVGGRRWDRETARAVARLARLHAAGARADAPFDPACLVGLPVPVRRYFAFALTPGQRLVRRARIARITHVGAFASTPGHWAPFTPVQHATAGPPGFVWDARIALAPLISVRVRDGYAGGEGSSRAAVVSVGGQRGTPELAARRRGSVKLPVAERAAEGDGTCAATRSRGP